MKAKTVAFNGSPRKGGNTETLLRKVLSQLDENGIATELVQIGGKALSGCAACGRCRETLEVKCVIQADEMNLYIQKAD
ncbi:MAG: flavodoxin family protein [Victivallales bacterium]|nr:flavodoxin family protein [Victivallales bacterium]